MTFVDRGSGIPVVLVPGIQGRWEWIDRFVDALARHARVITFSLTDDRTQATAFDPSDPIGSYVGQVRLALDQANVRKAIVCGFSYGGLVAAAFATAHQDRLAGLVLVSALPPSWTPNAPIKAMIRSPLLLLPAFLLRSFRLYREVATANGGWLRGLLPGLRHASNVLTHPFSPAQMARRARRVVGAVDPVALARLREPTLVVTGDRHLDRVVPVTETLEYCRIWPHAERATLARTGHLGYATRPELLAHLVVKFAERAGDGSHERNIGA